MAISRSGIHSFTEDELQKMVETLEEEARHRWAVYADYSMNDMTWRIAKVEPWDFAKHMGRHGIIRINYARDEIDAYMQAKEQLEGSK